MSNLRNISVGSFPYKPGFNPYQKLITDAVENAGADVIRIPPEKWFPVQKAMAVDCDVLHLDWPHDWYRGRNYLTRTMKSQMYLAGLRKATKTKIIWTAHNLISHDSPDPPFESRMIQALIDRCDGIMVMSENARTMLHDSYRVDPQTSVKTIYHGHYADCYPNQCTREEARRELGIQENQTLFVSIGTVKPYKGLESLIESIGHRPKSNFKWIIAGKCSNPTFGTKIESLCARAVEQGHDIEFQNKLVADDQLQFYFNAADACVLPFDSVLNSGSLLLAMSFGCPIVAPSVGSIPEVINQEWGFLYEPKNQQSLMDAMSKATEAVTRHDSLEIRRQIIDFVRQRYSWEQAGRQLVDWYREISDFNPTDIAS